MAFQYDTYDNSHSTATIAQLLQLMAARQADSLRRRGQITAQDKLTRGQGRAEMIGSLGQAAAGTIASYLQEKRDAPIRAQKAKQDAIRADTDQLQNRAARQALDEPALALRERHRQEQVTRQVADVLSSDASDAEKAAAVYRIDPKSGLSALKAWRDAQPETAKPQGLINVPPSGVVFDPVTQQPVYTAPDRPATPDKPPAIGGFEDYLTRLAAEKGRPKDTLTTKEIEAARKAYQQADDRPINVNNGPREMTEGQRVGAIRSFQRDWNRAIQPVLDRRAQTAKLDSGLSALARGERPAATEIIVIAFEKMQDETSVVREAEYGRPGEMQSLRDKIGAALTKLRSGGSNMTDANLRALAEEGKAMATALDKVSDRHLGDVRQSISETLDEVKIPHTRVFGSSGIGSNKPPANTGGVTITSITEIK